MKTDRRICRVLRLGLVDYLECWEMQRTLVEDLVEGRTIDTLLLLEHPPTYTLGKRGKEDHILASSRALEEMSVSLYRTDRGGDVTFHGPGQLVGYPVLDLRDREGGVSRYVRDLEESIIRTLAVFGITASRLQGYPGVWVGDDKIAAIGVKINARRISCHGFALNVTTDLSYFERIIPCGLKDKGVTSIARILGEAVSLTEVADGITKAFGQVFGMKMVEQGETDSG